MVRKAKRTPRQGEFWDGRRDHLRDVRRELAAAWAACGVTDSGDYRRLTNALFEAAFGMDVWAYRRHKHLPNDGTASLRDHMDEAELAVTFLAESLATFLLRRKRPRGYEAVEAVTRDAGAIAGRTRFELERRVGHVSRGAAAVAG